MNLTPVVKQLLIVNILVYLAANFVAPDSYQFLSLFYFDNPNFHIWQPFTYMFMHAPFPNLGHIFFNMFALVSFGSALEHFWGGKKFLFFYISCGLGAVAVHTLVNYLEVRHGISLLLETGKTIDEIHAFLKSGSISYNSELISESQLRTLIGSYNGTAVGASGAIYGLLIAFAFMFPNAELLLLFIPIPIKAKYFVPGILFIDLALGLSGSSIFGAFNSGIAHFAHLGGALVGFVMMWYWKKSQFNKNRWS